MNYFGSLPQFSPVFVIALLLWSLFWKALALWRAAKAGQRNWFVAILVLNTFGIVELIYLFKFAKDKLTLQDLKTGNFLPR